jgi:sterol 24-C-methyltransferase
MVKEGEAVAAMKAAGFQMLRVEDLAARPDAIPWYYPLAGSWKHMTNLGDLFTVMRMTWWGRGIVHKFMGGMETIGLFPKGSQKTADSLAQAADCLVKGGELKLFTPMFLMVGQKPE